MSIQGQGHFHIKIKTFLRNHLTFFDQILYVSFEVQRNVLI